ncbi:hypothetical protein PJI74_30350, partial [Mycobacterium kansasii]
GVAAAVVVAVLAGCTPSPGGDAVPDPSAVPRPDTGSFATSPRTVALPSGTSVVKQESMRMIATLPLISDIDPIFAFGGGGARE